MSFFSELLAGGASGLVSGIGTLAKDMREAITGQTITDPAKQNEFLLKMAALQDAAEARRIEYEKALSEGQMAINKIEAASASRFVAGWRPAVGWVCVAGLCYTFLVRPIFPWLIDVGGLIVGKDVIVPELPPIEMSDLFVLLFGMLGLAVSRTVEKIKGVSGK